ncbi:MAG: HAD family hydrolase [Bacteroidales bacterium]|nr:HAD family hydrolase [Bacteroidales bacterium]
MEHFSTLILDFDGTIADSVEGIVSTSMSTLKELSIPPVSREEVISLIGLPLTEMFRRMSSSDDESFLTLCTDTYRRIFKERALDSITLFPGVKESLFDLHKKGISLNIASSRSRGSIYHILEKEGMMSLFDTILGVGEVTLHKPHPEMVLKILAERGVRPEESLMVGDTTFDIMMGHAAGCPGCGVTYGNHSRETLMSSSPEFIIDSFPEIEGIIIGTSVK